MFNSVLLQAVHRALGFFISKNSTGFSWGFVSISHNPSMLQITQEAAQAPRPSLG